jgi:hypothetical protein
MKVEESYHRVNGHVCTQELTCCSLNFIECQISYSASYLGDGTVFCEGKRSYSTISYISRNIHDSHGGRVKCLCIRKKIS